MGFKLPSDFNAVRFTRNTGLLYQLFVRFVYTDNWAQRIICNCVVGSSVRIFDPVIRPRFIFGFLVQLQQ